MFSHRGILSFLSVSAPLSKLALKSKPGIHSKFTDTLYFIFVKLMHIPEGTTKLILIASYITIYSLASATLSHIHRNISPYHNTKYKQEISTQILMLKKREFNPDDRVLCLSMFINFCIALMQ